MMCGVPPSYIEARAIEADLTRLSHITQTAEVLFAIATSQVELSHHDAFYAMDLSRTHGEELFMSKLMISSTHHHSDLLSMIKLESIVCGQRNMKRATMIVA